MREVDDLAAAGCRGGGGENGLERGGVVCRAVAGDGVGGDRLDVDDGGERVGGVGGRGEGEIGGRGGVDEGAGPGDGDELAGGVGDSGGGGGVDVASDPGGVVADGSGESCRGAGFDGLCWVLVGAWTGSGIACASVAGLSSLL